MTTPTSGVQSSWRSTTMKSLVWCGSQSLWVGGGGSGCSSCVILPYPPCLPPGYRECHSTPVNWFWDYAWGAPSLRLDTSSLNFINRLSNQNCPGLIRIVEVVSLWVYPKIGDGCWHPWLYTGGFGALSVVCWLCSFCQQIISEDLWVNPPWYYTWEEGPAIRGSDRNTGLRGTGGGPWNYSCVEFGTPSFPKWGS